MKTERELITQMLEALYTTRLLPSVKSSGPFTWVTKFMNAS